MVQLTCIATRGGDTGNTSLGNGQRLSKASQTIETIGCVDELNSFIGAALSLITDKSMEMAVDLKDLQHDLFDVGADLCMPDLDQAALRISEHQVARADALLEKYNTRLEPLKSFVLPGGAPLAASLHVCRTAVRRAERSVVALHETTPLNGHLIRFLNRLSDVLFVMARVANDNGRTDVLWKPGKNHGNT